MTDSEEAIRNFLNHSSPLELSELIKTIEEKFGVQADYKIKQTRKKKDVYGYGKIKYASRRDRCGY
jgi:ribosomal protein L7/L12